MKQFFAKNYWMFILRGSLRVFFGFLTLFLFPILEFNIFSAVFGPFVFCEGALSLLFFIKNRDQKPWLVLFDGVVCLAIGIFIYNFWQNVTNANIFILIAIWAIVTGIIRAITAVSMYKQKQGTWLLGISALVSVLFGLMIIFKPYQQNLSTVWMISTFLVFFGALTIIIGIYFRDMNSEV